VTIGGRSLSQRNQPNGYEEGVLDRDPSPENRSIGSRCQLRPLG
jgi:hypothetical protein